jgi:tRNA U34 5-methylaminomethyl-2-thiouridine-forming methyltransferase MnmC
LKLLQTTPLYDPRSRADKQTVVTRDGSHTLYSKEFDEAYHSPADGALHESITKHIAPLFGYLPRRRTLKILDICFGLGYNTLATLHHVQTHRLGHKLHIVSPELDGALVASLGDFEYPSAFAPLRPVIEALATEYRYEDARCRIDILIGDAREILPALQGGFDGIYQDAFSPQKNPLLWTREYFAQIRRLLRDDGILTTYSVAASVRMGLDENGFHLYHLSGQGVRDWMIASPSQLPLEAIDMQAKRARNPSARSLTDAMFGLSGDLTC